MVGLGDAPKIIGESEKIKKVLGLTALVANTAATVLFSGESGTGKELFARTIHTLSPRREGPFVAINCAAIPETLIESELFGHEKGAFTDAKSSKRGRFELAHGGTLFLDEVSDLPLLVQTKVLRFLQEHTFERVGGTETLKADVRIVAATNSDLTKALKEKRFREDLYYRLNVFPITIPPLRERPKDIPLLVEHFLAKFSAARCIKIPTLASEVKLAIMAYSWPGNVRELENLVERALIHSRGTGILDLKDFTLGGTVSCLGININTSGSEKVLARPTSLKDFEKLGIEAALRTTGGHKLEAAKILGIDTKTLRRKIKEYKIVVAR